MDVSDLISRIEDLGLSNKESKVYVACLGLGASSVQTISDRAGIKRVTAYVILEALMSLGLVTKFEKGKKTYFLAADPRRLDRLLIRKADELAEQQLSLKAILPQLDALRSVPQGLPEITLHDGVDAVSQVFDDFITTQKRKNEELLLYINADDLALALSERSVNKIYTERSKLGRRLRLLYSSERGRMFPPQDAGGMYEVRFMQSAQLPIAGEIALLSDTLLMISLVQNRPIAIMINSEQVASSVKTMFEMAWSFSRQFNEN
jgi:predicted transcriptional regulator